MANRTVFRSAAMDQYYGLDFEDAATVVENFTVFHAADGGSVVTYVDVPHVTEDLDFYMTFIY